MTLMAVGSVFFNIEVIKAKVAPTCSAGRALDGLNICTQNCNSLSLSSSETDKIENNKFKDKIIALLKNKPDILLIQDIRLGGNHEKVKKEISLTCFGSYDMYFNSTSSSSRGVAILLNKNISYEIFSIYRSQCENIIILDMSIRGFNFSLSSIYGPTQEKGPSFYTDFKTALEQIGNEFHAWGGDLNAISDITPPHDNPNIGNRDLFLTSNIPNLSHSKILSDWIEEGGTVDVFRTLYPNKREYSYIPFGNIRKSRSRIDSIYTSPNLLGNVKSVEYKDSAKSTHFDHKETILKFKAWGPSNRVPRVDNNLLNLQNLKETVKFDIIGTILEHYDIPDKAMLKQFYEDISIMNYQLNNLLIHQGIHPGDHLISAIIDSIENNIADLCLRFPSLEEMYNFPCNISLDCALEVILNAVKNSVISFQSHHKKLKASDKRNLILSLHNLKLNGYSEHNSDLIVSIESQLTNIEETENINILKRSKHWEVLNSEKPNKQFANLMKRGGQNQDVFQIHDDTETQFGDLGQLGDYISDYYGKFFKEIDKPEGINIQSFLGEDLINSDIVKNKILTVEEQSLLEGPITIEELRKALDGANMSSAPGVDDISNKLIDTFWEFLKIPIRDAFNFMTEKGELHGNMKLAKIRIIPKADALLHLIKSWRPISLLTAPHKLYSGVISLRLKKVIEKVTSRCQKAYSSVSCIHEGLISTFENIAKSIFQQKSMALVLIDFSRAFDSIQHKYLFEVLRFFNFGEGIIKMIKTSLTNRKASVITGNTLTKSFDINSGTPQGDLPSPDYFKIAAEPLLIKILSSLVINLQALQFRLKETEPQPDNTSAFADDMDTFMEAKCEALGELNSILKDFGELSGLKINASKTKVITFGAEPSQEFVDCVNELGFSRATEFRLLGIDFDSKLESMHANWERVVKKIRKIKNFWSLFHLSIPGRICVAKTFMFSQLCYIGTILDPSSEIIKEIEDIISQFLTYKNNFAKSRVFLPVEKGGMGMFSVRSFLDALRVGLFKKSLQNNDTWALEMRSYKINEDDNFLYDMRNIDEKNNPIISLILNSYDRFQYSYYLFKGNVLESHVLDNKLISNGGGTISQGIFSEETWNREKHKLKRLKLKNCLGANSRMLNIDNFYNVTNIQLRFMEHFRLVGIINNTCKVYKNNLDNPAVDIKLFFEGIKKGSKKYRTIMEACDIQASELRATKSRYSWSMGPSGVGYTSSSYEREKHFMSSWNYSFLYNEVRDFGFKFVFNLLKLNAAWARIKKEDILAGCTFCSLSRINPVEKENLQHFFNGCNTVNEVSKSYFEKFVTGQGIEFDISFLLRGAPISLTKSQIMILNIEIITFCFLLYKYKYRKKLPRLINIEFYFSHFAVSIC